MIKNFFTLILVLVYSSLNAQINEDFENGATLPWQPLEQLTSLHGTFDIVDNPNSTGINTSAKVGKYIKGSSAFSTLTMELSSIIDIKNKPQYNLDVLAPIGAKSIVFQLENTKFGNKEIRQDFKNPGTWEKISFDFSLQQALDEWTSIKILFDLGTEEEGSVFYFDNLNQSVGTVNPCENIAKIVNIIDDFECQRNYQYGSGNELLSTITNAKTSPINNSIKVGKYKDQAKEPWAALCVEKPSGLDLSVFNQLSLQVISPTSNVPILFKLEGGSSPSKEIWTKSTKANDWEILTADFSSEKDKNHKRVCVFFNGGVETTAEEIYYLDNFQFTHAPYDECIINFDNPAFLSTKWDFFPSNNSGGFQLVDNPNKNGINKSNKVGKAIEKASGEQPWQGMFTDLESYIKLGADKLIKMKVLSTKVGAITMKLEGPLKAGAPQSGDLTIKNTKANEWEELTWDFSKTPIVNDGRYTRLTLIWDIDNIPTTDVAYYFDDIKTSIGNCGEIVSTNDQHIERMSISPNPVSTILTLNNMSKAKTSSIYDMLGRIVATLRNDSYVESQSFEVTALKQGAYVVKAFDYNGNAISIAKFIKL